MDGRLERGRSSRWRREPAHGPGGRTWARTWCRIRRSTSSRSQARAPWAFRVPETASRTHPKQINIKRVVCEMGGKNALIIDNDADLDEAIPAALSSAFGFTGQKCSALSRLLVLEEIYDEFVRRLLGAAGAIPVGDPAKPATVIGPVIDGDAQRKILRYIEQGRGEAQLAWQATLPPELAASGGWYVPPAIFTDVRPDAVIAREEIFGPVLAVIKVRDLDEAISVANDSDYARLADCFHAVSGARTGRA